ncbi:MAG: hypothetical protein H6741_21010 [Alphaproteobacteria bacterium]|nr:hypothetical protein [Alphaproteobacteria bacterium]
MNTTPILPLSQQILAWLLKSLGFSEDHYKGSHASPSTLKNAERGRPIPERWEDLIRDVFHTLAIPVQDTQLAGFTEQLRAWDREVSALPDFELPADLRLAPALRRLAVELGVRCGVLSATLSLTLAEPLRPAAREALTDPLSPAFLGRVVLLLLQHHRPAWDTWDKREAGLEGVISARTLERWHSGKLRVPAPSKLETLVQGLQLEPAAAARALMALRCARVLCCLRRDVKRWIGAEALDALTQLTARFAERCSALLQGEQNLKALAQDVAGLLDAESGAGVIATFLPQVPEAERPAAARRVGAALRSSAEGWGGDADTPGDKLMLLLWMLLIPAPGLMQSVFRAFGGDAAYLAHLRPLSVELGPHLHTGYMLLALSEGATMEMEPGRPWTPPPALQALARDALGRMRALIPPPPRPGEPDPTLSTLLTVLAQALGPERMQETLDAALSVPGVLRGLPPGAESLLPDAALEQAPNLMPERALRLVREGDLAGGAGWLQRWKQTRHLKDPMELRAAAEAHAEVAHMELDRLTAAVSVVAKLRHTLTRLEDDEAWVRGGHRAGAAAQRIEGQLDKVEGLVQLIEKLLPEGHGDEASRALLTLPLLIRLDQLHAALDQEPTVWLTRASPAAEALPALLDRHPSDGRLHALQALWQELTGDKNRLSRTLSEHHGCGALLETLRIRVGLSEKVGGEARTSG